MKSTETVRLGLMPPLTGLVDMYGAEIAHAGQIACAEVNESGGVLGRTLELVIEDDGSLPESAVAAANKLVDHHCFAIIGNLLSNSRIAVAYQVAEPRKIPYLNFSFYEGSILSRYFFHFAALPNQQIDKMIPYMRNKFGPLMFFAGNNYEWPRGSIDAAKRALKQSGGQVAGEEYYPIGVGSEDIERLLDQVEKSGADVFVPYFAGIDQVYLLTRFTERGLKNQMAVVMGHYDEIMASRLPPEVREGFYSSNTYFMTLDTPKNRSYLARLSSLPGVSGIWPQGNGILTNFGEGTYLCVKAFAMAANKAGRLDAEALVNTLESIRVTGLQGVVQMDPVIHHAQVNTYLSRCQADGSFSIIEQFGAIKPILPERYRHLRISQQSVLDEDIRLQARMLEQMAETIFLVSASDGTIIYCTSGVEPMFGYSAGELFEKHFSVILDPSDKAPDEVAATISDAVLKKGIWEGETRNKTKDGLGFWCAVSVSVFTHPQHGEVWMISNRNITERKELENQLKQSITYTRSLIEASLDPLVTISADGKITDGNEATLQVTGMRREDLIGTDFSDYFTEPEKAREVYRQVFAKGFVTDYPLTIRHRGGKLTDVLYNASAYKDERGNVLGVFAAARDITMRILIEQELQISEERLSIITASAQDAIIMLDEAGNIAFWNKAAERVFGYTQEEILGHNLTMLAPPAFREAHCRAFSHFQQTGQGAAIGKIVELTGLHKDGSEFPMELSLSAVQVKGAWHSIGVLRDITERKISEAAITESKNLLQTVIDTAPIRVFWKDLNLRYLGCNMAFARDAGMMHPKNIVGKDDYQMGWAEQAELYRTDDRTVMKSGKAKLFYEEPQMTPNGQTIWIRTSKVPLRNQYNEVFGLLGIYEDITEQKRLEDEREELLSRLQKITRQVPGLVYQYRLRPDGSSCFPFASDAIREIYRVSPEEVSEDASKVFAVIHPDDYDEIAASIQKSAQDLIPWRHEFRVKFDDGVVRWLFGDAIPQRETDDSTLWHGFITDITDRKQSEDKIHLAASVFTHAREGILITADDGAIIDVNNAFCEITGYSRDEVLGQNPRILSSGLHDIEFYTAMWRHLTEKDHWFGELWNRRKNGEVYAVMQSISAVRDAQGKTRQYVALFSDITPLKEHERQLENIAHYDALTSLPNRVLLADRLHQNMGQARRRRQWLAVAFLDLDGFKAINDNYGHEAGDQLLITVANSMKQTLREGDTLARLGGDEFIAVLLDLADIETSMPMLTRLLAAAAQPVQYGNIALQVSASLGVTFYPQAEDIDADQLLRQADQAMYQAKLAGKNRYHVFDAEQDSSIRGRHESLERIRRALTEREFVLYYQPKVNMRTGKVIGAEALIRWQHPERGLLLPDLFLPVINNHPLSIELGDWVIDSALAQMELWHAAGLDIQVSVNIGARQLQQENFVERLNAQLAAHPEVMPCCFELEVLETSALEDMARVSQVIECCRKIGVLFALDDFGTGYSSLTYLKRLPVAQLKLDQSFVRDMFDDPDNLFILEAMVSLATSLRRQVIAEGVATVEHGQMLLQLGCELAQGYYIAHPMQAHELPDWSAAWRPDPTWSNLPCVKHDDLPLFFAIADFRAWVQAVEVFLKGMRTVPPQMNIHQFRFDQWLNGEGLTRYDTKPNFRAIELLYEQVHALTKELCEFHDKGRNLVALAKFGEFQYLRDALLEQLFLLQRSQQ